METLVNSKENTLGQRIKELRAYYNLNVAEFAELCDLSQASIFNVESNRSSKLHRISLEKIAFAFGTSLDWLIFGTNKMLQNGVKDISVTEKEIRNSRKENAYLEIQNKNEVLEKEIERLWQMLGYFISSKKDLENSRI